MIISTELMGRVEIYKNCISVLMIIELLIILGLLIGSLTEIESESYQWFLDIKIENLQTLTVIWKNKNYPNKMTLVKFLLK